MDEEKCPPIIKNELAVHVSFNAKILQYALENWPYWDEQYRKEGKKDAFYYKDNVYKELGL